MSLKRNFPLQEVLSAAGKKASNHKRLPLPAFAVEDRDWLEALTCAPAPCSRREAGIAANDVVCSPLPTHLIPCLLQPLSTMLVSLYLDERLWLPAHLKRAARMIKSVMVSALNKKNIPSDRWWSHIDVLLQEADVAKETETKLLHAGILLGDDTFADSDTFNDDDDDDSILKFEPSVKHHGGTRPNLLQNISVASTNKLGFQVLIAGSPRSGQRHLASCLLHCFVGNVEVQKVDIATILQEGHGDMVQGMTQILMKCANVGSCMIFMPRIDLWAVEIPLQVTEESDSDLPDHQLPENEKSYFVHGQAVKEGSGCTSDQCKSEEMGECTGVAWSASHAWNLFVEQVESICVSSSLMILATSDVPYPILPVRIRQFFKSDLSNGHQSIPVKHTVPRFSVQVNGDFNHDLVINLSATELLRDIVQQVVLLIHQTSHIRTTSCHEYQTCDTMEGQSEMVNQSVDHGSADANNIVTQCPNESLLKAHPPPNNRTVKGKSSLLLAISSFGYQILRYPHFAELCWFTSKLREGPSADISGPWKGWPFNSCIVRPNNSFEKIAVACSSSNIKSKEKLGLVRGLIAVGLSAYRGVYTSLREVSFEIRKVLEILVAQINAKIQAGKDRYQYVRLLSQVAYLEDMVNSWAYTLHSLELDAPIKVENAKLIDVRPPADPHVDNQVQSGEPKLNDTRNCSDELKVCPQGFDTEKIGSVESVDIIEEDGNLGHPNSEDTLAIGDLSGQKIDLMNSTLDKSLLDSNEILNDQSGAGPKPHESDSDFSGQKMDLMNSTLHKSLLDSNEILNGQSGASPKPYESDSDLSGQKMDLMNSTLDKSLLDSNEIVNGQSGAGPKPHESDLDFSGEKMDLMNSTLDKSLLDSNEILNGQSGASPKPHESETDKNHVPVNGDSGSLKHSNGFECTESAIISEDGLTSDEFGSVKLSRTVCNELNGLPSTEAGIRHNDGKCDADEHIVDVDFLSKTSLSTESGVLCLYRCCPACVDTLHSLTQKILIHKWESSRSQWTVEDVHDIVASVSLDLLSAVRRTNISGGFSNSFNDKIRDGNNEKFEVEWPESITCHCKVSGNKNLLPVECRCHTISESTATEGDASPYTHPRFDLNFIFRDGVLVHMDPDKDVSFHCKFETLCLCSLIELIVMTKQPFH